MSYAGLGVFYFSLMLLGGLFVTFSILTLIQWLYEKYNGRKDI